MPAKIRPAAVPATFVSVAVILALAVVGVESRSTKLTRNKARRNRDLGIEAVRGVIDGGGNKASGNGDPAPVHEHRMQLIGSNQPPLAG